MIIVTGATGQMGAIIPLTNPIPTPKDLRTDLGDDPKSVGAPTCEIEITPAMIKAGCRSLYLSGDDPMPDIVL